MRGDVRVRPGLLHLFSEQLTPERKRVFLAPDARLLLMKFVTTRARLALQVAALGGALLAAAACSERSPAVPTDPTAAKLVDGTTTSSPGPMQIVVLRPVMTAGQDGQVRSSYVTQVVRLRPVMKGEPLPAP